MNSRQRSAGNTRHTPDLPDKTRHALAASPSKAVSPETQIETIPCLMAK